MELFHHIVSRKIAYYRILRRQEKNARIYLDTSILDNPHFAEFNRESKGSFVKIGKQNNIKIGFSPKGQKSLDCDTIDIFEKQEESDHYLGSILLDQDFNTFTPQQMASTIREGLREIVVA